MSQHDDQEDQGQNQYQGFYMTIWYSLDSRCKPKQFEGTVTRKLVRAKSGPGGPLLAPKIGPTPDYFWLPNLVRVAKSGPGFISLNETIPCPVKFVYMVYY